LDNTFYRPGTELRIKTDSSDEIHGFFSGGQFDATLFKDLLDSFQLKFHYSPHFLPSQKLKHDYLIDAIQKFWFNAFFQQSEDLFLCLTYDFFTVLLIQFLHVFLNYMRANV